MLPPNSDQIVRFAGFEFDLFALELRRSGVRLPVQGRPLQVLATLLRTPGKLVTGEQLRTELWPADTFVDFEHGVRNAVARLRAVLGDNAEKPRFVETLPRRGYRFIGTVTEADSTVARNHDEAPPLLPETMQPLRAAQAPIAIGAERRNKNKGILLAAACLLPLAAGGAFLYERVRYPAPDAPIRSLAVLPLENLSGDPTQDYFADGVTDELITALAKLKSVSVISRTSSMQYKGVHNKPLPQIARELGVDAIVEGTLAQHGDRIRVTAQLIQATRDRHVWAERYDRSSRDILLLENDIARTIAAQIRRRPDTEEEGHFNASAIDPAAHEAYLEGLYLWNRRSEGALKEAVAHFTHAIEIAPGYAEAYAGRADAYIVLGGFGLEAIPPREAFPRAKADAEKALHLDSAIAEAHTALAVVRVAYEWDWAGARKEFQRAIELSPSNATARQWYGQYLCDLGRFDECLAETSRAHALDPAYLIAGADVGYRMYEARRYKEAIAPLRKLLEFDGDFIIGHRYLGQVYEANGMYAAAITELRTAVTLSGSAGANIAALGHAYAASGDRHDALKEIRELDRLAKERYVSDYGRALIWAGLGQQDRAMQWLQGAFEERSAWMMKLKVDPRLELLHRDPRFADVARQVGLTL